MDEAGTFKTIYSSQLDQNQSDNKFAGWHEQIEAYFGYPTYYDQATGVHKQGCFGGRTVGASGDVLSEM